MVEGLERRPRGAAWQVGELLAVVADHVRQSFPTCLVQGEISGFSRAASGHCYFNLKDPSGGATLRCALFRRAAALCDFLPADGHAVELRGRVDVYEQRGEVQLVVESMQRSGAGALYERFLRLRAMLASEGLFDEAKKRPLPAFPRTIGIVTSLGGAVLHDVATTLARRSPQVTAIVYPSLVQGPDAPAALCEALRTSANRAEVDVLVVCRGGGSLEDLWAFNDERVVRAIGASPMPVVSAVGHETDVTLADLAADLRAPTPTAAAELVAPAAAQEGQRLDALNTGLIRLTSTGLDARAQHLDRLGLRLARPADDVRHRLAALEALDRRLAATPHRALELARHRCGTLAQRQAHATALARARLTARIDHLDVRLRAVDPGRVLARGFALLTDPDGHPLGSVARLEVGQGVVARLHDGSARLDVVALQPCVADGA